MDFWLLFPPTTIAFLVASLLIELTPGPNMTYLALVAASDGRRAGFETVLGIFIGLTVLGMVAAFGAAEIIQASSLVYEALRWSGVAFLLYLSWEGWTQGTDIVSKQSAVSPGHYFIRGLLTNVLNPKAALFYLSVLPTFIVPGGEARQAFILTSIYVAVATGVHSLIVVLAGTLEALLNQPALEKLVRRLLSGFLAIVALWFAWNTR